MQQWGRTRGFKAPSFPRHLCQVLAWHPTRDHLSPSRLVVQPGSPTRRRRLCNSRRGRGRVQRAWPVLKQVGG